MGCPTCGSSSITFTGRRVNCCRCDRLESDLDRLQRERDEALRDAERNAKDNKLLAELSERISGYREALHPTILEDLGELFRQRDIALEALRKMRREIERPTPAGHLKRMRRILDKAIERIEGGQRW